MPEAATDKRESGRRRIERRLGQFTAGFPLMLLVLIPSWLTFLTMERPEPGVSHLLFYSIPDLHRDPLSIPPALLLTPLVNTETDQMILVTVLIATFGVAVERRLGIVVALALFWGTSTVAALGAGVILHALYPFFSHVYEIDEAWHRLFNGGSAGGIGLMGALAAISRPPWSWFWLAMFVFWEAGFWIIQLQNFTPTFHLVAFPTGYVAAWWWVRGRRVEELAEPPLPVRDEHR